MPDPTIWPSILVPQQLLANPVPFTRSGGKSIGGIERTIKTDRGSWVIGYRGVVLYTPAQRRMWAAFRLAAGGRSGLLAVPTWQNDVVPTVGPVLVPHSDDSPFSDDSLYSQPGTRIEMATIAARGATSVTLRLVYGVDEPVGIRFSYQHALYETGFPTHVIGTDWTVPVFPAIRQAIPADVILETDLPTCLVRLATDDAMDGSFSAGNFDKVDVDFVEATDYWADL